MKSSDSVHSFFDLDLLLMVLLGAFSGAFLLETRTYNPTAALFPRLVSAATFILVLWTVGLRLWSFLVKAQRKTKSEEEISTAKEGSMIWYISLITMVVYYLLIYVLGFIWSTLLYLFVLPLLLGYKKYWIVLVTAVLWTAVFVYVFTNILYARIPKGILGNFL